MFTKLKKIVSYVASGSFVILFVYLMFFQPRPDPRWMSEEATKFIANSMSEFCSKFKYEQSCSNKSIIKKNGQVFTVRFSENIAPSAQQIDEYLIEAGWKFSKIERHGGKLFCKPPYFAVYERKNGYIAFMSFGAIYNACDERNI